MTAWNTAGALIMLALGLLGLARPDLAARFTSLEPVGLVGRSEVRATYGGFFFALGAAVLATADPLACRVAGLAWAGAALGRLLSAWLDHSRSPQNLGGVAFEAAIAALLLVP
ncbi:MAG TPA: DUF4345 family protein [Myxococcota bacterium]|nr:DUF4345 family protein [Myxococcota bacterium]